MPLPNAVAKFLASVPAMCGFYPEESLLVIHLKPREDGRERVGVTMRLDIDRFIAEPEECSAVFAKPLRTQPAGGVVVIAVSKQDFGEAELPWHEEIKILASSLTAVGHTIRAVYFLPEFREGVECRCYCPMPDCGGTLPDPAISPVAVVAAASGLTVQPNLRTVENLFAPASEAERAPIETATHQALEQLTNAPQPLADRLAAFDRAVTASGEALLPQDREHLAHLIANFASPPFRDACVVPRHGTQPELQRLNVLLHLHRLAPAVLRPQIGTALAASHRLIGEYLHVSLAAESVQPPTLLADVVANRVSRGTDPFSHDDGFPGYFRSARDCSTVLTRTVAAQADPLPRLRPLLADATREIEAEHRSFNYWALQARLHRIDAAVAAWANGRRPRHRRRNRRPHRQHELSAGPRSSPPPACRQQPRDRESRPLPPPVADRAARVRALPCGSRRLRRTRQG